MSISVIGSFRQHYSLMVAAAQKFSRAGIMVPTPTMSAIINPGHEFARLASDDESVPDHHIQAVTLNRILASDVVYVVAPDGYVGRTTSYELGQVAARGIPVFYSEPPRDLPIEVNSNSVVDPDTLVGVLNAGVRTSRPRVSAQPTADLVVFTIRQRRLKVLLVTRGKEPYKGMLALPGGFVRPGESLEDTAVRELLEETGLDAWPLHLNQFNTYSEPNRDPRGRVITTAFLAIAPDLPLPIASTDAHAADWYEVDKIGQSKVDAKRLRVAFDHERIVADALENARTLLERTPVAQSFCSDLFTMTELREVYEAVWREPQDPHSFRRRVEAMRPRFVVRTEAQRRDRTGRPAALYRAGPAKVLHPPLLRAQPTTTDL